jgi:hypothetical protein
LDAGLKIDPTPIHTVGDAFAADLVGDGGQHPLHQRLRGHFARPSTRGGGVEIDRGTASGTIIRASGSERHARRTCPVVRPGSTARRGGCRRYADRGRRAPRSCPRPKGDVRSDNRNPSEAPGFQRTELIVAAGTGPATTIEATLDCAGREGIHLGSAS